MLRALHSAPDQVAIRAALAVAYQNRRRAARIDAAAWRCALEQSARRPASNPATRAVSLAGPLTGAQAEPRPAVLPGRASARPATHAGPNPADANAGWSVPVVTTSLKAIELAILLVLISLATFLGRIVWAHDWAWPRSVVLVIALCSVVALETLRM